MPSPGEADNVLRVGLLSPVESLDPRGAWEMGRALVTSQIFETPYSLVWGSTDTEPLLFAEELRSGVGGPPSRSFSARIPPDLRFSDGSQVSGSEVAEILNRSRVLTDQAKITAQGDRIDFLLKRPNPRFDLTLTLSDTAIVRDRGGTLLGTGPYVPTTRPFAGEIRLARNPHYRHPAAIPEIEFKVYPPDPDGTPRRLIEGLESGEIDFTNVLSREHLDGLRTARRHFDPGNSTVILFFNTERWSDPHMRRALATAIDRRGLAELLYSNAIAYTATGLLPPTLGRVDDGIRFDAEAARSTLAASSTAPKKLTLLTIWSPRTYLPHPQRVAQAIASNLGDVGIEVEIEQSTGPEDLSRRIASGRFDLYLGGWVADTPDAVDFLEALLASSAIPEADPRSDQANFSRWRRPEADQAIERFRQRRRNADRAEVIQLVGQEVPVFPLLYGPATAAHSPRLLGFHLLAIGHPRFASMRLRGG